MKNSYWKSKVNRFIGGAMLAVFGLLAAQAQSTNQNFPTPVAANEISGRIVARDVGDSRLTVYYYAFGGGQGDLFVNVKTSNLDGDIDVFTADNLRPLTKIRVLSDVATNETGRVIYLRKPERLILRVEGRTPNDAPATFNLKFAGSFTPAEAIAGTDSPDLPQIKVESGSGVRVNSVGTIIEAAPVAKRLETETAVETNKPSVEPAREENAAATVTPTKNPSVKSRKAARRSTETNKKPPVAAPVESSEQNSETIAAKNNKVKTPRPKKSAAEKPPAAPNPLENVRLLITLKDGTQIERAMSEVLRVGVDKGVLTLITKNGAISRYSILDVAKMTIE